jgi:hypothetical protein
MEPTLATGLIRDDIIQVTPSGVYFRKETPRTVEDGDRIIQASICGDKITLVVYHEIGSWTLMYFRVEQDDEGIPLLVPGNSHSLEAEPSVIKLVNVWDNVPFDDNWPSKICLCIVAFRHPRKIVVFSMQSDTPEIIEQVVLDDDTLEDDEAISSEIHSIDVLRDQLGLCGYLLLGTRHGLVLSFRFRVEAISEKRELYVDALKITKFGESQVEFLATTHDNDKTSVFLSCAYVWELSVKDDRLQIDEVLFDFRMVCLLIRINESRGY